MNIAYRCKLAGITMGKLANDLGFTQGTISRWNSGATNLIPRNMKKIADYFGITVDELLSDPEDIDLKGVKPAKSQKSCENNQTSDHRARIKAALAKKVEQLIPGIYDQNAAETVKTLMEIILVMENN